MASGPRRWAFRSLASVGVPLLLLLLFEACLRLAGCGYSPDFFVRRSVQGRAVWTDNPDFGRRFFARGLLRYPRPFTLPVVKPPGTLRVLVLGESAAMGDPDPKCGLPRMLAVLLRERYPERRFEVVNVAMAAINSHAVLPIARECAGRSGDLWVVYMGNNEVIGPFGAASIFGAQAPPLPVIRAALWAKETRLGQCLDAGGDWLLANRRSPRAWEGMEMMAGQRAAYDAPANARVHRHFEQNLRELLDYGVSASVPVVLCTVGSNLRDCPPFASLHRVGLTASAQAQWQAAYDAAVVLQDQGNPGAALIAYEQAAGLDDDYAELAFRRAECALRLGREAEAASLFRRARDLDALQFRADSRINEAIRQCALAYAGRRVHLVDAAELLAAASPQRLAGNELFYEHVHLTPEGNYLLARAVAEQAAGALALGTNGEWVPAAECFRLLGLSDWSRHGALGVILDRVQRAPFVGQAHHALDLERLEAQLARYRPGTKPAQIKRDLEQASRLVARDPDDPDLRWTVAGLLEAAGDLAGAEAQWRALVAMQPQAALPRINLAALLERLDRPDEARLLYEAGLRVTPEYHPARLALGELCLRLDRVPEAIRHLELTVQQQPSSAEARLLLSRALARANRTSAAAAQLREVLRLDPNNAAARAQLQELTAQVRGQ